MIGTAITSILYQNENEAPPVHVLPVNTETNKFVYAGHNINRNPLNLHEGEYATPLTGLDTGSLPTRNSRSIVERIADNDNSSQYIWHKGTGNPSFPYLPPLYLGEDAPYGYKILFGVTKTEVDRSQRICNALTNTEALAVPSQVQEVRSIKKIPSVPVPLKSGFTEIRDFVTAFSSEWEIFDQIRKIEIAKMRETVLVLDDIDHSKIDDEKYIAQKFFDEFGFWQIETISDAPFKNEIYTYIANPMLIDYTLRNKESTPDSQAKSLQQIYIKFLEAAGVKLSSDYRFPDHNKFVKVIDEIDPNLVTSNTRNRPFLNVDNCKLTKEALEILSMNFYGNKNNSNKLMEIDGQEYFFEIYNSLNLVDQSKLKIWLNNQIRIMAQTIANSIALGLDLKQSPGAKDSFGGKIGDLGDAYAFDLGKDRAHNLTSLIISQMRVEHIAFASLSHLALSLGINLEKAYQMMRLLFESKIREATIRQKRTAEVAFSDQYYALYNYTLKEIKNFIRSHYVTSGNIKPFDELNSDEIFEYASTLLPVSLSATVAYFEEQTLAKP